MAKQDTPLPMQTKPGSDGERGVVLVWALLTAFLVAGIVLATSDEMRAVNDQGAFAFSAKGQVEEVAQAGLIDAVAWFRSQSTQPVKSFNPKGLPPALRPSYSLPPVAQLPPELSGLASLGDEVKVNGGGNQIRITDPVTGEEIRVKLKNGQALVEKRDAEGNKVEEIIELTSGEGVENYRVKTMNGKTTITYEEDGQTETIEYDTTSGKGIPPGLAKQLEAADYYSLETVESETPELGLVRTYQLTDEIWARYTVNRGLPMEPFTDSNGNGRYDLGEDFEDINGDERWSEGSHSRDVGHARGLQSAGTIWYITSHGEIFRRVDPNQALGEGPNVRLASSTWGTELRRMGIASPAAATLCVQDGGDCKIGKDVTIRGSTAIAYDKSTKDPKISGTVTGALGAMPSFKTGYEDVFGVPWTRLMSMADIGTSTPKTSLPARIPASSLVVISGKVEFDKKTPLTGNAMVIVRGDCTIKKGSNSFFSGILYVDGDLKMEGPALVRGTTIVTGKCDIKGSGSDAVELEYDENVVSELLSRIGQYRYAKAPFRVRGKMDSKEQPATEAPVFKSAKVKSVKVKSVKVKSVKVKSVKVKSVKVKSVKVKSVKVKTKKAKSAKKK